MTNFSAEPLSSKTGNAACGDPQGKGMDSRRNTGVAEVSPKYLAEAASHAIPVGYKQTEVGVIPEDWGVADFGSTLKEFRNGYAFSASGYASSGTPIITMAQIGLSGSFQFDLAKVNKWDSQQHDSLKDFWVQDGDLLIAMTDVTPDKNLIGQMTIAKLDGIALLNQRVGLLRLKTEIAYSGYFSFLSCLPIWKTYCKGVASLGVQANIGTSDIRKAIVPLPPVAEQTAIANALSDVDALISELEKLIAKKQAIKTATMQQLLTGRTRLPQFAMREDGTPTNSSGTPLFGGKGDAGTGGPKGEGQDDLRKGTKPSELGEIPEDWEVKTVFELADYQKSLFDDGDWIEAEHITSIGIRLIQTGNIGVGRYVEKDAKKYIFEESFEKLKCKELHEGDLLICRLAEPAGRACILPDIGEDKVITSVDVTIFRPAPELANREFYNQYFSSSDWFKSVLEQVGGTTHKRISRGALGRISVCYPNVEEQTAIATILSDMDAEIQALEQRLGKTRHIKQGMMQELLTGKTRLIKPSKEVIHE